jgi:apolipoprotein N-acyltransferase
MSNRQKTGTLLEQLIGLQGIPMVISGYQTHQPETEEEGKGYFNVAEFITAAGEGTVYRKQKLLPFGEYLPFEQNFPWLRDIFPSALHYLPGEANVPFMLSDSITLLPLICYEVVFPEMVRDGIRLGGNVVINPVDDAWFGMSNAPEIHMALALFRAVEFRMPIVRASNSGRSVLIDITGEIVHGSQTELFQRAISAGQVTIADIRTPYQVFDDVFLWLTGVLSAVFLVLGFLKIRILK